MTISVIIPTFSRPEFLIEAIHSVWNQAELPKEIIIGDDSFDNRTNKLVNEEIIPQSSVPVRYFHHSPPLGQGENVDFLIRKVEKEALILLHDDDLLLPGCIKVLKAALLENPRNIASFGKQHLINNQGEIIPEEKYEINKNNNRIAERAGAVDGEWAAAVGMFTNNAFLVRTKNARKIGYAHEDLAGDAIDFYFGFLLGKENFFYYVNEYTSLYRISDQSVSKGSLKLFSAKLDILLKDLNSDKLQDEDVVKSIKWLMNPALLEVIKRGQKRQAIDWMRSPYYNLLTPKGMKRMVMLFNPFYLKMSSFRIKDVRLGM